MVTFVVERSYDILVPIQPVRYKHHKNVSLRQTRRRKSNSWNKLPV